MKGRTVAAIIVCLMLCTCATMKAKPMDKADPENYRIGALPASWKAFESRGADRAFEFEAGGSSILVNSSCGWKTDAPLTALTNHLLLDMTDRKILMQAERSIDGRPALETVCLGSLDGTEVKMKIVVLRSGDCLYDLVCVSLPPGFDAAVADFDGFVGGFRIVTDSAKGEDPH